MATICKLSGCSIQCYSGYDYCGKTHAYTDKYGKPCPYCNKVFYSKYECCSKDHHDLYNQASKKSPCNYHGCKMPSNLSSGFCTKTHELLSKHVKLTCRKHGCKMPQIIGEFCTNTHKLLFEKSLL